MVALDYLLVNSIIQLSTQPLNSGEGHNLLNAVPELMEVYSFGIFERYFFLRDDLISLELIANGVDRFLRIYTLDEFKRCFIVFSYKDSFKTFFGPKTTGLGNGINFITSENCIIFNAVIRIVNP